MKVKGSITVDVDPKDVIQGLLNQELNTNQECFEREGSYYIVEQSSHRPIIYTEISKERYDYILSLKKVLNHLTL